MRILIVRAVRTKTWYVWIRNKEYIGHTLFVLNKTCLDSGNLGDWDAYRRIVLSEEKRL
jgi:hypothetical protein